MWHHISKAVAVAFVVAAALTAFVASGSAATKPNPFLQRGVRPNPFQSTSLRPDPYQSRGVRDVY